MPTFKVGDRVRVKVASWGACKGMRGKVVGFSLAGTVLVYLGKGFNGHSGSLTQQNFSNWYFAPHQLSKVRRAPRKRKGRG